ALRATIRRAAVPHPRKSTDRARSGLLVPRGVLPRSSPTVRSVALVAGNPATRHCVLSGRSLRRPRRYRRYSSCASAVLSEFLHNGIGGRLRVVLCQPGVVVVTLLLRFIRIGLTFGCALVHRHGREHLADVRVLHRRKGPQRTQHFLVGTVPLGVLDQRILVGREIGRREGLFHCLPVGTHGRL